MTTETQAKIIDDGQEQSITRSQEETLLLSETIYWCDECNVYHLDFNSSWKDAEKILKEAQG